MTVVSNKLRQAILLLASDHPGEVAAAASAITRMLKAQSRDWHWLADQLDAPLPVVKPVPRSRSRPAYEANHVWMASQCVANEHLFRSRELEFLESMIDWDREPTPAQAKWLNDLYRRVQA